MTHSKAPKIIWDKHDREFCLTGFTKSSATLVTLHYQEIETGLKKDLYPSLVETQYFRDKPSPQQDPILQGKYECAPAALAMALGEKLFHVKRQMGKLNWRNDDSGVDDDLLRATARAMGRDLVEIPMSEVSPLLGPCILTVKSLNVKGYSHAIAWNGKELLDPNTHYSGRHYWGSDWTLDMIEAKCCHLLLDHPLSEEEYNKYIQFLKDGNERKIEKIKQDVLIALQKPSVLDV